MTTIIDGRFMARSSKAAKSKYQDLKDEIAVLKWRRILDEACLQFYQKGYDNTSIEAIAEGIGVTKPFIYTYYDSKAEILGAVCRIAADTAVQSVNHGLAADGSPRTQLTEMMKHFTTLQIQHRAEAAVYFRELKNLPEQALEEILQLQTEFHGKLSKILEAGLKSGEFKLDDPSITASAMAGMVCFAYTWYNPEGKFSIEELSQQMVNLALNMVLASEAV